MGDASDFVFSYRSVRASREQRLFSDLNLKHAFLDHTTKKPGAVLWESATSTPALRQTARQYLTA
jgi:hypothetical protein